MIIWIASYPKSGNTWVRSFLSSYYYSGDGNFNFNLLKNIDQYPQKKFFENEIKEPAEVSKYWKSSQQKIVDQKKIKIFKTHNSLHTLNGFDFTSTKFTLGVIYIIRDPRNVITSLKNHFDLSYDDALEFMLNKKKFIHDNRETHYADFHFLSSWSQHYKSWLNDKSLKTILVKYEDLETKTYETFEKIVNFVNDLSKSKTPLNKSKVQRCIETTGFDKLKKMEKENGFDEAIYSKKLKKKMNFFNLGSMNKWKNVIPEDYHNKINTSFEEDLKFLKYI